MKDDRPYLADILQALHRVEEVRRRGAQAFRDDWVLQDAAIRNFEIVGEAVKRVSPALQAAHPEIPWADLAGFRDVLIHQYFRVDLEIRLGAHGAAGRPASRGRGPPRRRARRAGLSAAATVSKPSPKPGGLRGTSKALQRPGALTESALKRRRVSEKRCVVAMLPLGVHCAFKSCLPDSRNPVDPSGTTGFCLSELLPGPGLLHACSIGGLDQRLDLALGLRRA